MFKTFAMLHVPLMPLINLNVYLEINAMKIKTDSTAVSLILLKKIIKTLQYHLRDLSCHDHTDFYNNYDIKPS